MKAPNLVEVFWADLSELSADDADLLDQVERDRAARYVRSADRDRFVLAAAMVRSIAAEYLGVSAAAVGLDRRCPDCGGPHGKTRVRDGSGLEVSVTHSGSVVGAAFADRFPVGLDVEEVDPGLDTGITAAVLAEQEADYVGPGPEPLRRQRLVRIWTRKEAVLKAAGLGLRSPLRDLVVTSPDEPAQVLHWAELSVGPGGVQLADLDAPGGHPAAVAALTSESIQVRPALWSRRTV